MHIAYTPEQERLRSELRGYFAALMTPRARAALTDAALTDTVPTNTMPTNTVPINTAEGDYGNGDAYRAVVRQLGADGWLALSWPGEYGGRGGTMLDQLI